jgi:hypothetical protein
MPPLVANGASLQCSFGAAPSTMVVTPENKVTGSHVPVATIMDHVPMKNIMPFGMCSSLANPTVAAATAAALGVLTPMPCVPATSAPWMPPKPMVKVNRLPVFDVTAKCMCNWAGVIQVVSPGQTRATAR